MADLPQTRHSLLLRLKGRSDDAWSEFLAIYEKSIVDYARRKGLQEADARDVTQEILSVVESKVQSWDLDPAKGKFRGWLFRVARNIAVDAIVSNAKSPRSGGTAIRDELYHVAATDEDTVEFLANYRRQLLHWAVEKVRPRVSKNSWRAFWMTSMEGRETSEVAATLGISKGNVYAAKFRVMTRIQKAVAQFDLDEQCHSDFSAGAFRNE